MSTPAIYTVRNKRATFVPLRVQLLITRAILLKRHLCTFFAPKREDIRVAICTLKYLTFWRVNKVQKMSF